MFFKIYLSIAFAVFDVIVFINIRKINKIFKTKRSWKHTSAEGIAEINRRRLYLLLSFVIFFLLAFISFWIKFSKNAGVLPVTA
jgi:ABC-type branched-subunit amino acid transport system permease subunit